MKPTEQFFSSVKQRLATRGVSGIIVRYVAVLIVIGLLSALVFWGSYSITLHQTHDATVVEVAGKQRTLRLSVELLARQIINAPTEEQRTALVDELETELAELETTHNVLAYGKYLDRPTLPYLPEAQAYIFGPKAYLDRNIRAYIDAGHALLIAEPGEIQTITRAFSGMLDALSSDMDMALDGIVAAYKQAMASKVATLQSVQIAGLFFILSALVISALAVFRPMEKQIKEDFKNLNTACDMLHAEMSEKEMARIQYEELGAEHAAMAEELEAAVQQAEKAERIKSSFLANMSHELRTPMNAVLGFCQLLQLNAKDPLSDKQRESVGHIFESGQHLLKLIDGVLDQAKIESGVLELHLENVGVRNAIDECVLLTDVVAKDRQIEIIVSKNLDTDAAVYADRTRFKQSLLNLLSNAIKYNRKNGRIDLDCHETPSGMLHISVADTGEGIPDDMLEDLFMPFNRLTQAQTEIEGTGIGLTLTKELINRMNGRIGVESEVGKGSVFWIELPLSGETQPATPATT